MGVQTPHVNARSPLAQRQTPYHVVMGIQDREYYKDWKKEQNNALRPSLSGFNPPTFGPVARAFWRSLIHCLAIYGAVSLLLRYVL